MRLRSARSKPLACGFGCALCSGLTPAWAVLALSCAARPSGDVRAAAPPPANGAASTASPTAPTSPSTHVPSAATHVVLLPRLPEIALSPKEPLRPLPELKVENIGLHVGGGPNDAETKAPFQRAIAQRFPTFLECYRHTEEPAKGGRFGIDLHIPRGGGHPRIEPPRTAMRGPDFRACVSAAFESVVFDKPARGPTTISYSLHFTVGEAP